MSLLQRAASEVFSVQEVARAAGVTVAAVRDLTDSGRVLAYNGFVTVTQALRCIRLLRLTGAAAVRPEMFAPPITAQRSPGTALAASGALHLAGLALVIAATTLGWQSAERRRAEPVEPARLVFLAVPGPGGGGGGGGLLQPAATPKAEMQTAATIKSPVPPPRPLTTRRPEPQARPERPVAPRPTPQPVDPPPPAASPVSPQVAAPVATASSDARDRAGVLADSTSTAESHGPGTGTGAGAGTGSGLGEGTGAGIGPGSGGGTGGGPYRPGSGITAPSLLHEVRPDYTDDARRQGVEGDVVLELIVRRDGTVGDVRVLEGLRGGLDRRAIDAVRQWRFSPARRYGTPVDVLVEVAVEFKLR